MKNKMFFKNALILLAGSFLMRTLGVAFGAYLTGKMGAEGMGLFQLISTVYGLASTFATSGIYLSVTRLVAEEMAENSYTGANDAMKKCMGYGILVSLLAAAALFALSRPIGETLLGDARTILSLRILAFALPFMALSSSLRGYFFALRMAGKSSGSQLMEQLAHIFTAVAVFSFLAPGDLEWACAAAASGCLGGEAVSFLFSLALYLRDRGRRKFTPRPSKDITKRMLRITLPVAFSTYLKSTLRTVENLLIPRGFKKNGASGASALAQYGMTEAMVMPILTFPSAFLTSFSSLLVPEIAEARARHDEARISRLASKVLRYTLLFSAGVTGVFVCFPEELGWAVYRQDGVGGMLGLLAPLVPLMYLDNVADTMLKGMDEQLSVLRYSMADSVFSILCYYFLLPLYGVKGYIFVLFASTFLNSTLSFARLAAVTRLQIQPVAWIIKPALSIAAAVFLAGSLARLLPPFSPGMEAAIKISLAFLLYLALLCLTRTLDQEDFRWLRSLLSRESRHGEKPAPAQPEPAPRG